MIRLLLVEDDVNLSYIIQNSLEDMIGGYDVTIAPDGKEGLKLWKECKPDIIISDIDMPVMNGYEMVEKIRETDKDTLILFASGKLSPKDVTSGYKVGANNYVKKPFVPEELNAHIQSILSIKSGAPSRNRSNIHQLGNYILDANHAVLKHESGKQQALTVREAQVLQLLCENKNEVVRREAILSRLWDTEGDYFASRSLDVFVSKLRKLLSEDSSVEIKTVKGVGLMLVVGTQ